MTKPAPPPVPAPVDVEAVVRAMLPVDWYASSKLAYGPGDSLPHRFRLAVADSIRRAYQAGLAARSTPVDVSLLETCREALEAAKGVLMMNGCLTEPGTAIDLCRTALEKLKP